MMDLNRQVSGDTAKRTVPLFDQQGYVLLSAMLALCLLSLFGLWALNTSNFELKTAANRQMAESNFNIADGAGSQVGTEIGYCSATLHPWFQLTSPTTFPQYLVPTAYADYDPGSDITGSGGVIPTLSTSNYQTWPRGNLLNSTAAADNAEDYAYLVTYLKPTTNHMKGYNATKFSAYEFRISTKQKAFVEIGGITIGIK